MARAGMGRSGAMVAAGLALALALAACPAPGGTPTGGTPETRSGTGGTGTGSGGGGSKPTAKPATPRPTATPTAQGTLVAEDPRRAMSLVKNKAADGSLVEVLFEPQVPAAEWKLTAKGVVLIEAIDAAYRVVAAETGALREAATTSHKPLEVRWPARIPDSQPMSVKWTVDQGRIYELAKADPTATGFEVVVRPKGPGGAAVALADGSPFELTIAIKAL